MFAKLLSGELIALQKDTPALEQLSQHLGVSDFQIHLEPGDDGILYVVVSDFRVEWVALPTIVLDLRGGRYHKFQCVVNDVSHDVYQGEEGYGLQKKAGHSDQVEVIYPIREWKTREEMEQHLGKK